MLTITAVSQGNAEATVSTTFNVRNADEYGSTQVFIDLPNSPIRPLSGRTEFAGWAINNDYTINTVTTLIDRARFGTTDRTVARQDVCDIFPNAPSCPNVGWSFPIDTTLLANGVHKLEVVATSSNYPYHASQTARRICDVHRF
jgi:hypothetical protein